MMNERKAISIAPAMKHSARVPQSYGLYRIAMSDLVACWKRRAKLDRPGVKYVEPGEELVAGKRAKFEKFVEKRTVGIVAPWVLFVPYPHGLTAKFLNGRHRTAVLRDAGAEYINVQTDRKSVKNAAAAGVVLTPVVD